jgi:hypothetical protein
MALLIQEQQTNASNSYKKSIICGILTEASPEYIFYIIILC